METGGRRVRGCRVRPSLEDVAGKAEAAARAAAIANSNGDAPPPCARQAFSVDLIKKRPCWFGNLSGHSVVTNCISKITWTLWYGLCSGNHREPRARGRVRVTVVTRRRACVALSVLWEMEKSPCCPCLGRGKRGMSEGQ